MAPKANLPLGLKREGGRWWIRPRMPDGTRPRIEVGQASFSEERAIEATRAWFERRVEHSALYMKVRADRTTNGPTRIKLQSKVRCLAMECGGLDPFLEVVATVFAIGGRDAT